MDQGRGDAGIASALFVMTIVVTITGIFISIYLLFVDPGLAYRTSALFLVGIVGILSFIRHSIFYQSDQSRMGWIQDHPGFQLEVGYANLAMGIVATVASVLNWGPRACGITLLTYGLYLFCTLILHVYEIGHGSAVRYRAMKSAGFTAFFVIILLVIAFLALTGMS
jgi:hypothetical protein